MLFSGCKDEGAEYRRGFKEGSEAAEREQFERGKALGYAQGFATARPGSPSKLTGAALIFYKVLIWGGALTLLLSLAFTAMLMFRSSDSAQQTIGKVLYIFLGAIAGISLIVYTQTSEAVMGWLLIQAPDNGIYQAIFFGLSAIFTMAFFQGLSHLAEYETIGMYVESFILAIMAAFTAIALPALLYLYEEVPDITAYITATFFMGALFGGLFWIANKFLDMGKSTSSQIQITSSRKDA